MNVVPHHNFEKLVIATRYRLLGLVTADARYMPAYTAFEEGLIVHRNDRRASGIPGYIHQLEIFSNAVQFHHCLRDPWIIYALIFLHDMCEDHNIPLVHIESKYGEEIAGKIDRLSKVINGKKKEMYRMAEPFEDPHTAVAKTLDRCNNVASMAGVFKLERLERYVKETREVIIPLIKASRRQFPDMEPVFENAKLQIEHHLRMIEQFVIPYMMLQKGTHTE